MGAVIISLLPFILGSAIVPMQIIIVILLLKSPTQGLLKATAYVGGMTTIRDYCFTCAWCAVLLSRGQRAIGVK